jgi:hypothetical protein
MSQVIATFVVVTSIILGASAFHKVRDNARLSAATGALLHLRPNLARAATLTAAAIELAGSTAILVPALRSVGALLVALLWAAYASALIVAVRRGERGIDCGCDFGSASSGIDSFKIWRACGLAAIAAMIAVAGSSVGIDLIAIISAIALIALLLAADEIANQSKRHRIIVR